MPAADPVNTAAATGVNGAAEVSPGNRIACAVGETDELSPVCTLEATEDESGVVLTLRQPDGGFHRIRKSGEAISAADGAEKPGVTRLDDGSVVVAIGDARYRLPASSRY